MHNLMREGKMIPGQPDVTHAIRPLNNDKVAFPMPDRNCSRKLMLELQTGRESPATPEAPGRIGLIYP